MEAPRRMGPEGLTAALAALGELLRYRGLAYEVVVVGGANLLLRGAISRPTKDADLIGERLASGQVAKLSEVPPGLARAVSDVAATFGLDRHWLNVGPSSLMDFELPEGFPDRLSAERFGSLTLWLAGEFDMICFKLYAVVDQWPRPGRHLEDLQSLDLRTAVLLKAAAWCRSQDPSPAFEQVMRDVLRHLDVEASDG
jgi:hypothetical protein